MRPDHRSAEIRKTVLAVQIAIAVARGQSLFDAYRVLQPGAVMLQEQDDAAGPASVREILRAANVRDDELIYFSQRSRTWYLGRR